MKSDFQRLLRQARHSFRWLTARAVAYWLLLRLFVGFYTMRYGANQDVVYRVGRTLLDVAVTIAVVAGAIYVSAVLAAGISKEWQRFQRTRASTHGRSP